MFDGKFVSLPQILWETSGPCTWRSHHRKTCFAPLRSWRGSGLFSPVSASGALCLWCLGKHMGRTLFDFGASARWSVRISWIFDARFVSKPGCVFVLHSDVGAVFDKFALYSVLLGWVKFVLFQDGKVALSCGNSCFASTQSNTLSSSSSGVDVISATAFKVSDMECLKLRTNIDRNKKPEASEQDVDFGRLDVAELSYVKKFQSFKVSCSILASWIGYLANGIPQFVWPLAGPKYSAHSMWKLIWETYPNRRCCWQFKAWSPETRIKKTGPPFTFFGTIRQFKILIFRPIMSFAIHISTNNFFQYSPNFRRYIQSKMRFTKEEAEVRKRRSHVPSTLYRNFWSVFWARKTPFGCFDIYVSFSWKKSWAYFQNFAHFESWV